MSLGEQEPTIDTPDGPMAAFCAGPGETSAVPRPGIVLLMDAFGLTPHLRGVARRLAAEGHVVLAPDLYHREPGRRTFGYDDEDEAMQLMHRLDLAGGLERDLRAALAWLAARPGVRADRIGVAGFGLGGGVAFYAAIALSDQLAAAAGVYGIVPNAWLERVDEIRVPLLLLFGGLDPYVPLGRIAQIKLRLAEAGKDAEVVVYREADHGFFCDESDTYDAAAAQDAWRQVRDFFARVLSTP